MSAQPPSSRRVAVIGDVAGHLDPLRAELVRLGADPGTGRLPADLTVVQVGDLVHRGPDSAGVVALVDDYLTRQPGQWVQLVGNHEAQYLAEPAFAWPERLPEEPAATLRRWWRTGAMRVATAVLAGSESFLLTHAGLTAGFWRQVLGVPIGAGEAAEALNALAGRRDAVLFRPGHLLTGGRRNQAAGPLWAASATELVPSWLDAPLPFSQVHGHTSVVDWRTGRVLVPAELARLVTVDEDAKHGTVALRGGRLVSVDPGHDRQPQEPWRAWVVEVED